MGFSELKDFIEKSKLDILDIMKNTKSHYAQMNTTCEKVTYSFVYVPMYIVLFSVVVVCVLLIFSLSIIRNLRGKIQIQKQFAEPYMVGYTENVVGDILYEVLENNASVLGISMPKQLKEIIPTKTTVIQQKNGFTYYHFIVHHPDNPNQDFLMMRNLITIKIEQILQAEFYNYPLIYNTISVLQCINVNNDKLHEGYYSIDIMVVDNELKYQYVTNCNNRLHSIQSTDIDDEEF